MAGTLMGASSEVRLERESDVLPGLMLNSSHTLYKSMQISTHFFF